MSSEHQQALDAVEAALKRAREQGYDAGYMDALKDGKQEGPPTQVVPEPVRILTCVYCGHEYPQDAPAWGDKTLTDHIAQCDKHPMRAVIEDRDRLHRALTGLVGSGDPGELREMEAAMRVLPAPEADKAATIDAIHALLAAAQEQGVRP